MTTRRGFLVGAFASAASGLILPSFYERALAYIHDHDTPWLPSPRNAGQTLFARFDTDTWYLTLGKPLDCLPEMNWAEIWTMTHGSVEAGLVADHGYTFEQLARVTDPRILEDIPAPDDQADEWSVLEAITPPERAAFDLLWPLDLSSDGESDEALGEIEFWEACDRPRSDYYGVHVTSDMALSCLQHRLNVLGTGIGVEVIE